jgi:hypothetical protein
MTPLPFVCLSALQEGSLYARDPGWTKDPAVPFQQSQNASTPVCLPAPCDEPCRRVRRRSESRHGSSHRRYRRCLSRYDSICMALGSKPALAISSTGLEPAGGYSRRIGSDAEIGPPDLLVCQNFRSRRFVDESSFVHDDDSIRYLRRVVKILLYQQDG